MARVHASVLLLCALCVIAAGCGQAAGDTGSASPPSHSSPPADISASQLKAAALNVLDAYNHKDASAVCSNLSLQTNLWLDWLATALYHQPVSCEQVTAVAFAAQPTESQPDPGPAYKHVAVKRWMSVGMRDGYGRVEVLLQVTYPDKEPAYSAPIVFYFTDDHGKLLLARQPDMSSVLLGTDAGAETNIEPTAAADVHSAISIPPPDFPCSGAIESLADAADDVGSGAGVSHKSASDPAVDIRKVVGHGLATKHPCVEIDFAAPIRPPTRIQVMDLNTIPNPEIAIGPNDDFSAAGGVNWHVDRPYGERGNAIFVALDPSYTEWKFDSIRVCVDAPLSAEPFLRSVRNPADGWQTDTPGDIVNDECAS